MILYTFCYALLLVNLPYPSATEEIKDKGVVVLTDDNFQSFIEKNENVLVEFYAPWCGHCKSFAPEYEAAARKLVNYEPKVILAKLDCIAHTKAAKKYSITSYPTLKLFRKKKPLEYKGPKDTLGVMNYVERRTQDTTMKVTTHKEVKKLATKHEVLILGLFKNTKSKEALAYINAAQENGDIMFGITDAEELMKEFGVDKHAVVSINEFPENINKIDSEKRTFYKGAFDEDSINTWAGKTIYPTIIEFSETAVDKIENNDVQVHFVLFIPLTGKGAYNKKNKGDVMGKFADAAKKMKNKFLFVFVDSNKNDNAMMIDYFGRSPKDAPFYLIFDLSKVAKFFPKEFHLTTDAFLSFAQSFLDGTAIQFYRSARLPDDWDSKPLKYVVQSNFYDVVYDKSKDVLVLYMSNECEDCGVHIESFGKISEELKDKKDKLLVYVNGGTNEFKEEHLNTDLFPSVKLFKKNTNEIVEFRDQMTKKNLKNFLLTYEQRSAMEDRKDHKEEEEEKETIKEDAKKKQDRTEL